MPDIAQIRPAALASTPSESPEAKTAILAVRRLVSTPKSLLSEVWLDDAFLGYGLEPPWDQAARIKPRAIPPGRYRLILAWSPAHRMAVPHVMDVPGFEAVEIHIGNWPRDTKACLLVGLQKGEDTVLASRDAFGELMKWFTSKIKAGYSVFAGYSNEWPHAEVGDQCVLRGPGKEA